MQRNLIQRTNTLVFLLFSCMVFSDGSAGKESACNMRDLGSIPGLGRFTGKGNNYPVQYSGLENPMDCIVHGSWRVRHNWMTFTFTFHFPVHNTFGNTSDGISNIIYIYLYNILNFYFWKFFVRKSNYIIHLYLFQSKLYMHVALNNYINDSG